MTSHLWGYWHASRLQMMRLILLGAICLVSLPGFIQQAFADYQNAAFVENPTPTTFSVVGNRVIYISSQLDPLVPMTAKILVKADAGVLGRITEVHAWLFLKNMDWDSHDLSGYYFGYHKNYEDNRPRSIDSTVPVRIPADYLGGWMAEQCNALGRRLHDQGLSEREIWGQDRNIRILAGRKYAVGFTAPKGSKSSQVKPPSPPNVTLTCKKFSGFQGPGVGGVGSQARIDRVESAILKHGVVAGHSGVCRLNLDYAVRTNHKNVVVKFRLKDDKGRSSEVKTLTTNDLKIGEGSVSYNIPNNVGAEIGKIRMHGESPDFLSNQIEYRVVCHTPPAGGLTMGQSSGGQSAQRDKSRQQFLKGRMLHNRLSEGRQRIGSGVRSRGIEGNGLSNLPPLIIPDPEPPALPAH
ncbi:MAG: hypothetical protein OEY80_13990 [Nitrospirota bacterium]|nr:hypothetical protein [Nitrospirota bacterium]MDH5576591.1 hypothetical protein [Nitrospirota bacterium]